MLLSSPGSMAVSPASGPPRHHTLWSSSTSRCPHAARLLSPAYHPHPLQQQQQQPPHPSLPLTTTWGSRLVWSHALQRPQQHGACAAAGPHTHCAVAAATTTSSSFTRRSSVDLEDPAVTTLRPGGGSSSSGSSSGGPSSGGPPGGRGDEGGDDREAFGANFGEAVLALREDLPCLFMRDPHWGIFREDITFRTPSMRYSTGMWKYKLLHRAGRALANLLYADMQLSLGRMWQPAGNRKQLRVRWCVSGRPRLSLAVDDQPAKTEVIATYVFDSRGRIYEHQIDQIIPPESPLVQLLEWLVARLQPGMVPQPQLPIPGLRDGLGSTAAGGD